MINIENWLGIFIVKLNEIFGDRIWFVGLQGSYGRGEATETSDIDVVVILDQLSVEDIKSYGAMLDTLPHRDLVCGFLSGKEEILNWEPSDMFQFCHDTTPIVGSLNSVLSAVDESAVNRAIKIGVCNIYHGCVHNMLHRKSEHVLRGLYKSASFVVQAIAFLKTGKYIKHQKELLLNVSSDEQTVIETFMKYRSGQSVDFEKDSQALFTWTKKWITKQE